MKRSIAGDATKLMLVKVMTTLLTMLSAMLLSRFRTLDEYGTYSQIQLVITLVVTIFMIGLPNSINYFLSKADTEAEQKEFLSIYYTLCTIAGFVSGLVIVIMLPVIIKFFDNQSIGIFWYFLLLYPWTKIVLSGIENILIVFGNMSKLIVFKTLYSIVTLAVIMMAWIAQISFYYYMILFLGCEMIFSVLVYRISSSEVGGIKPLLSKTKIKEILWFSLPVGLASIVGTISIELDKMMIGYLYNTKELAIYTNASKEMPVAIVASSITAVLMPQLVKLLKKDKKEYAVGLWKDATHLSFIFIAFISVALYVFAPEVITILYSSKYLPGVNVFRVYSIVLLLRVTYFGMILNATGRTKFIFTTSIISLVLNVILNFACYFVLGFIGPAIATFLSIAITAFIQLRHTSQVMQIGMAAIFPWIKILKITVLNIIMGVAVYYIKLMLPINKSAGNIGEAIALILVWGLIYLIIEQRNIFRLWNNLNQMKLEVDLNGR